MPSIIEVQVVGEEKVRQLTKTIKKLIDVLDELSVSLDAASKSMAEFNKETTVDSI